MDEIIRALRARAMQDGTTEAGWWCLIDAEAADEVLNSSGLTHENGPCYQFGLFDTNGREVGRGQLYEEEDTYHLFFRGAR